MVVVSDAHGAEYVSKVLDLLCKEVAFAEFHQ